MKKTLIVAVFLLFNFSCAKSPQTDAAVNLKPENTTIKPDAKPRETPVKKETDKETNSEKTVAVKDMPQRMLDLMANYGATTKFSWTERDLNNDGAPEILISQIEEDVSGKKVSIRPENRNMWIFAGGRDNFSILNPLTHPIAPDPAEAVPIVSYKLRFVPRKDSYDDIYTVRRGLDSDPETGEKLKNPEPDIQYIYKWIDGHYWWCGCKNLKTGEDIYERELKKEDPNHDFGNPPEGKKCPN
jgi:hypothetical protein